MRNFIVTSLLFLFPFVLFSQYATRGAGSLKNEIWWLDWAGIHIADGASRTFNTADGMTIKVTLSNVTGLLVPDVMNTWTAALLHNLYDFDDPGIMPNMHSKAMAYGDRTVTLTMESTRGGTLVPFSFVASDGEGSSPDEWTILTTTGSAWQTIEYYTNSPDLSDPIVGCNNKTIRIYQTVNHPTFNGGRNPVVVTNSSDGKLTVDVKFERHVPGGMAIAFGVLAPIDRGDLPPSYGAAQHQLYYRVIDGCNYLPPFPSLELAQPLYIGDIPGDADGYQTNDDNATGGDEDGIVNFPPYDNSGTYSLPVKVFNQTGNDAFLSAYFDFNRNGQFDAGEEVHATVPNNATSVNISWVGLPTWLPLGVSQGYGFRFRISSDMASAQSPGGSAVDGEVEDYFIDFEDFCNIKVATVNDTTVCPGKPVQLFTTGGITYSWNKADYLDDISSAAPVANAATATTYIVTGANPQGCTAKDTITIDMLPVPALSTSGDISICRNSTTALSASAPAAVKFSWQPATGLNDETISNPLANPATETEYTVTAEDLNGCTSSSKLKVMFWPMPSFNVSPLQKEICEKEIVEFKAEGADEYTWSSQDNTPLGTSSELSLQATVSQVYKVEMRSLRCGESNTIYIPVLVNPLPKTSVTKSNDLNCRVGQATLHAFGGDYYRWDALPGIVDLKSPAPTVNPLVSTKYYVSAFSYKGCQTKDSVMVEVNFTAPTSNYPVPSAFTPNNDGKNDCFGLKQWGNITALDFSIFNRWGQLLFRTNDPLRCWDGRYNGQLQPAAGYSYQIKATTACGTVFRKGIVLLIR